VKYRIRVFIGEDEAAPAITLHTERRLIRCVRACRSASRAPLRHIVAAKCALLNCVACQCPVSRYLNEIGCIRTHSFAAPLNSRSKPKLLKSAQLLKRCTMKIVSGTGQPRRPFALYPVHGARRISTHSYAKIVVIPRNRRHL
jgi:hypothetical protein